MSAGIRLRRRPSPRIQTYKFFTRTKGGPFPDLRIGMRTSGTMVFRLHGFIGHYDRRGDWHDHTS